MKDRDEVLCNYCGLAFEVRFTTSGKVRLREI
jgi:hypothetical protein